MAISHSDEVLQAGELIVRPAHYTATVRGHVLSLSVREFELLVFLSRRAGQIVRREDLYVGVWGDPFDKHDRSVDVYVHKLRAKLAGATPEWTYIHTHFGLGYRFHAERSQLVHNRATTS
jgi:DNA-binding response OmpR family regulator